MVEFKITDKAELRRLFQKVVTPVVAEKLIRVARRALTESRVSQGACLSENEKGDNPETFLETWTRIIQKTGQFNAIRMLEDNPNADLVGASDKQTPLTELWEKRLQNLFTDEIERVTNYIVGELVKAAGGLEKEQATAISFREFL